MLEEKKSRVLVIGGASETKFNCKIVEQVRKSDSNIYVDFLMMLTNDNLGNDSYPFERVFFFKKSFNIVNMLKLVWLIRKYDVVVFNGIFYRDNILLMLVIACLGKKTGWIIWGGDLYRNYSPVRMGCMKILNLSYLGLSLPQDLRQYNKVLGEFSGVIVKYWFPNSVVNLPESKLYNDKKDNVRVLVGNSASETNRHVLAFEKLYSQKNQNFSVVLPLAYGDESYRQYVIEQAILRFGEERVEIIDKFMEPDLYSELIKSVDIVFFNHNRQQGGQNLLLAAALRIPIVLSKENIFYEFLPSKGVDVNCVDDFDDVKNILTPSIEGVNAARKIVSDDYSKKILEAFFLKLING